VNIRDELLEAFRAGNFLEAVFKCSLGNGDRRVETAAVLATLHNETLIDIVSAFEALKKNSSLQADFFLTRHIFEEALPEISAPTASVLRCVTNLFREAGDDHAAGTIVVSYSKFLKGSETRCREALQTIEENPSGFSLLLPSTIAAGMTFAPDHFIEETIRLCSSDDPELKTQALASFLHCPLPEGTSIPERVLLAVENTVEKNDDDRVLSAALVAAFSLFEHDPHQENRILGIVARVLEKGQQYTIYAASEIFGFHTDKLTPSFIEVLAPYLLNVAVGNLGTVRNIDYGYRQPIFKQKYRKSSASLQRGDKSS
jgi:hypothetical protein